jgi:hypothetical protein
MEEVKGARERLHDVRENEPAQRCRQDKQNGSVEDQVEKSAHAAMLPDSIEVPSRAASG